jgi:AcrR family transcriptional regulator
MRSDLDDDRIARLYAANYSVREVAAACGCSPGAVRYRLGRKGVSLRPRAGRPLDDPGPEVVSAMAAGYTAGESLQALGDRFETSAGRVRRLLERRGVKIRRRGRPAAPMTSDPEVPGEAHEPRVPARPLADQPLPGPRDDGAAPHRELAQCR